MREYTLFTPPGWADLNRIEEWPKAIADRYRAWVVSIMDERIEILRRAIVPEIPNLSAANLEAAGLRAAELLLQERFPVPSGPLRTMSPRGASLATDMGLYVARCLFEECGDRIRWMTPREKKKDVSYNMPVIAGFGPGRLDPIGGSMAEAYGILRGRKDGTIWKAIYDFWRTRA